MAISMLKIRRPLGRLIFNMGIAIPGKTVFLIETAPKKFVQLLKYTIFLSIRLVVFHIVNQYGTQDKTIITVMATNSSVIRLAERFLRELWVLQFDLVLGVNLFGVNSTRSNTTHDCALAMVNNASPVPETNVSEVICKSDVELLCTSRM